MTRLSVLLLAFAALLLSPFGQQAMAAGHCLGRPAAAHHMDGHGAKPATAADGCCTALVAALPDQSYPAPVPPAAAERRERALVAQLSGIEPTGQDPPPRG
ncbi:hypothetical protein HMF7854_07570 [Sphingomonas ginkgonis]|uniref:DUF2946 domain-containing protein n=1 Tax=Sphingomonas ginkgonis TaxID=2315330 RepID=A0A429V9V8_9SPHN|nr:hypothetical protein [Sphingomonas ginkgonis]RST30706.1 hypothetical protein HMF7854_07570 [Sphingomonas ginkgonis]